jgi:hypothetical protein
MTLSTYPTGSDACKLGTQNTLDSSATDGTYNWSCSGMNGGSSAQCSAKKQATTLPNTLVTFTRQTMESQTQYTIVHTGTFLRTQIFFDTDRNAITGYKLTGFG